jgi:hypothetical protein
MFLAVAASDDIHFCRPVVVMTTLSLSWFIVELAGSCCSCSCVHIVLIGDDFAFFRLLMPSIFLFPAMVAVTTTMTDCASIVLWCVAVAEAFLMTMTALSSLQDSYDGLQHQFTRLFWRVGGLLGVWLPFSFYAAADPWVGRPMYSSVGLLFGRLWVWVGCCCSNCCCSTSYFYSYFRSSLF